MDKELKQIFKTVRRQVRLDPVKKVRIRQLLITELRLELRPPHWSNIWRWSVVSICALLALGGGLSTAAERSLPGEWLYPVKILVTEPAVGQLIAETIEAQAKRHTQLIEKRLVEAEKLDEEKKLDEPRATIVREEIEKHWQKVEVPEVEMATSMPAALKSDSKDTREEEEEEKKENQLEQVLEKHKDIVEKLELKKKGPERDARGRSHASPKSGN